MNAIETTITLLALTVITCLWWAKANDRPQRISKTDFEKQLDNYADDEIIALVNNLKVVDCLDDKCLKYAALDEAEKRGLLR